VSIARIRIAPTEHWCAFHARHFANPERMAVLRSLVGMEVEIIPNSMRVSETLGCLGRIWCCTDSTLEKINAKGCNMIGTGGICEHILELD
jgi:hypothetical protein